MFSKALSQLDGAVAVSGGLRAVARHADVDSSNLAKFLKTGAGLSEDSQRRLEAVLGRPGGRLDSARVHVIRPKKINAQLGHALSWYLPEGGDVARATWSGFGWERIKKTLKLDLAPEVYAIRSLPDARLLVLPLAGLMLPRSLFGELCPGLHWWGGEPERAELSFDDVGPWISGHIDPETFDQAWPQYYDPTAEDLLNHVRRLKISWREAIRRVTYNT